MKVRFYTDYKMMNMQAELKFKIILTVSVCLVVGGFLFIGNEARKEVYYLCGNFAQGHELKQVTEQLNTINLSQYSISNNQDMLQIVHSSQLNFNMFSCTINFDKNHVVSSAKYG